jgi:Short-chain dehydrogenases of various substrate specificities
MTKTALITGSTSGIGYSFTNILAQNKHNLILVSRNAEKLKKQAYELSKKSDIKTYIIACDLSQPHSSNIVYQKTQELHLQVDILINNAGFNECGSFLDTNKEREVEMVFLHTIFPTEIIRLFLPNMINSKYGRILNVGSTGSYIPCPYDAVYAATKAYILSFSKGLSAELKGSGVTVTTLCPGSTKTEFAKKAGMEETLLFKLFVMQPETVATIGYKALMNGKVSVISGFYNKLLVISSFLLPKSLINFLTKKMFKVN